MEMMLALPSKFFVQCSDVEARVPAGAWSMEVVSHAVKRQCIARQLPPRLAIGFAGAFTVLALLCAPAAFKKDKMLGFTLWSTLSIATIVLACVMVSIYAGPAAGSMADCRDYDPATVQGLNDMNIFCVKGPQPQPNKTTALKWLCKLHTFFGGAAVSILSLLMLFAIKACRCCNPNAASCCSSAPAAGVAGVNACHAGGHQCVFRRAVHNLKARFCRRPALSSSADRDDGLPVSAPSYYEVQAPEASQEGAASEDAGVSPSNNYYGVN